MIEDRRAVAAAVARVLLTGFGVLILYVLLPFTGVTALETLVRLVAGIAVLVIAVGWQMRAISRSERPMQLSFESVALLFWILIVVFAIVYASMSAAAPESFTEPLNQVGGLDFTATVLSTVGFGDIAPVTDAARVVVMTQMALDVLLVGLVVRVFLNWGRAPAGRTEQ